MQTKILKADFVHRPGHIKIKLNQEMWRLVGTVPSNDCGCVCVGVKRVLLVAEPADTAWSSR